MLFKYEKIRKFEIIVNFVSKSKIKKINMDFLNHNYVTDIITFPYVQEKYIVDGELIISHEKVKENAKIFKTSYIEELKRVIIHGCLHLVGYNDENEAQKIEMRIKENIYLKKYNDL